jgi:hypothetical protein
MTVESICSMNRATARMSGVTRITSLEPGIVQGEMQPDHYEPKILAWLMIIGQWRAEFPGAGPVWSACKNASRQNLSAKPFPDITGKPIELGGKAHCCPRYRPYASRGADAIDPRQPEPAYTHRRFTFQFI